MKGSATTPQVADAICKIIFVKVKPVYLNRVTDAVFLFVLAVNNLRHFTFYCFRFVFYGFRILNCLIYVTCK